ncbi:MAG TPA: bifunctional phosphopantothenoylcysteine decarboxylase/phosphopantothenate--cysteine ligase CoaBC [Halanaerobiales bacterium]|nr:bifunctional phosphopantothenoylcysteine decarboxylase/phosphopantothenate--cysteine ligase CoaBC [Halanaerobiales bacterium]
MEKKTILLGISGGIAAYKMAHVASSLTKMGHEVHVVMTESSQKFISPVTFRAITGMPVETDLFTEPNKNEVKHIALADKSDLVMVAPATANIIGKIANGIADDLLSTIITAVTSPVIIAPAMNVNMYNNKIIQDNLNYLNEMGYEVISPSEGMLACGYTGKGRLPEPDVLLEYILRKLTNKDLTDKKVLITAGPTREAIDPVRYITNHSSGKMGYALAKRAAYRGAQVKLIAGPTNLKPPLGVGFESISSAKELYNSVITNFPNYDMIIMAAAVADFTPQNISEDKIKKSNEDYFILELKKTKDILQQVSQAKKDKQTIVGFAAESRNLIENAKKKMNKKDMDMIVANDIKNKDIFGSDESEVIILTKDEKIDVSRSSKEDIADKIYDILIK